MFLRRPAAATGGAGKRSAEGRSKLDVQGSFSTKEELDTHLQNLCAFAWDWGLTREQLLLVVELFTKHQLRTRPSYTIPIDPPFAKRGAAESSASLRFLPFIEVQVVKRLLESLIPQGKVDEECFVLILGR